MIAPARTGSLNSNNTAVITTDQTNKGTRSSLSPLDRILMTVVIKLSAPIIDLTPARWSEKIAKSTEGPAWAILLARGG